jgi:hypothetical protein
VLNEDHASKIARDWNVKHSGSGYVTRFRVRRSFLDRYQIHQTRAAAALADSARRGAGTSASTSSNRRREVWRHA